MFFIVLPSTLIGGTAGIVKDARSVSVTMEKIPRVLITGTKFGSGFSPFHEPHVCTVALLAEKKKISAKYGPLKSKCICHIFIFYLDSVMPVPDVDLSLIQPSHGAIAIPQVMLPLAKINITRRVAVRKKIVHTEMTNISNFATASKIKQTEIC